MSSHLEFAAVAFDRSMENTIISALYEILHDYLLPSDTFFVIYFSISDIYLALYCSKMINCYIYLYLTK